jgi:uncharacterized protein (TIGR03545 family)
MEPTKDMSTPSTAKPAKKTNKKGPIRFEAVVPFLIACALIWAYFTFFFDGHMRRGLEYVGTLANGAEVNVGTFRTRFLGGGLTIRDVQVTNPEKPTHNRLQLGEIRFAFLWDALLRAKFVVRDASVLVIETDRPRKKPGHVLPPEPPGKGPSWATTAKLKLIAKLREELDASSLGRAAKMLEGFNPQKALEAVKSLKTVETIDGLIKDLANQEKVWSQALSSLPGQGQVDNIRSRLNSIDLNFSNPAEAPGKIAQVNGLLQEAQGLASSVKGQADVLMGGVTQFGSAYGKIESSINDDRKSLELQLSLPKLDAKDLAKELFGKDVLSQAAQAERYAAMAREYMPAKGEKEKPAIETPPRGQGKNYKFGTPRSYPMFWLQKSEISSKISDSEYAGNFEGKLMDFSTEPELLGRPAIAEVKGEFTKQQILGIVARAVLDHTKEVSRDEISASVASFPIDEKMLTQSEEIDFGFSRARGQALLKGVLEGERLVIQADSTFRELAYLVRAKSRIVEDILKGVVSSVQTVTAQAQLVIENGKYDLDLRSNLASELERGFKKQLEAKVAEARRKIEERIQAEIGAKKAEFTKRYETIKGRVMSVAGERKAQVEAVENQAREKINAIQGRVSAIQREQEDRARRAAEDAARKQAEEAKKRFGF